MRRSDVTPPRRRALRVLIMSALGVASLLIGPGVAGAETSPPPQADQTFGEDGGNWAGYVATGEDFRSVSARWIEPAVTCGSPGEKFAPWVGIDGYGSSTVQQTGVATDCSSGKPVYRAWHETVPAPPVYYPLPVQAGDAISTEVTREGSAYTMTISNLTRNWTRSVVEEHPDAENVSAEVALEWQDDGFPDFGKVDFTDAKVNGKPLGEAHPTAIDATGPTGFLTGTGPLNGSAFSTRYLDR